MKNTFIGYKTFVQRLHVDQMYYAWMDSNSRIFRTRKMFELKVFIILLNHKYLINV